MIGREVAVTPGSYQRVVCIGAGALRMYSYIADTALLCGVEDIDNTTLAERPKMFDAVARPYVLAYGDVFAALPSCGVGGPTAQAAEAEKILSCQPDIIVSEYEDVEGRRPPAAGGRACHHPARRRRRRVRRGVPRLPAPAGAGVRPRRPCRGADHLHRDRDGGDHPPHRRCGGG